MNTPVSGFEPSDYGTETSKLASDIRNGVSLPRKFAA
jgi:hypothetical protein